jgi:hypothetical protein
MYILLDLHVTLSISLDIALAVQGMLVAFNSKRRVGVVFPCSFLTLWIGMS